MDTVSTLPSNLIHNLRTRVHYLFTGRPIFNRYPVPSDRNTGPMSSRLGRFFRSKRVQRNALGVALAIHAVFQLFIFIMIITFIKRGTKSGDPNSPEFAMYKNSDFKDCASSSPFHTNCTWVNSLGPNDDIDPRYLQWFLENNGSFLSQDDFTDPSWQTSTSYTWCELVSCLKGFEVIPSSPHPSAFFYSNIMIWSFINLTVISTFWTTRRRIWGEGYDGKSDVHLGIVDWIFLAYDLCSFILWWRAFGFVAEQPYYASDISILAWITPFRHACSMPYPPYSNWFTEHPNRKIAAVVTLSLITFIQWIASVNFMSIRGYDLFQSPVTPSVLYRRYDCLQSQISNVTGTSVCSPEQLCAKDWLFSDVGFDGGGVGVNSSLIPYFFMFIYITIALIIPFIGTFSLWADYALNNKQLTWERTKTVFAACTNWGVVAVLTGYLTMAVVISIGMMHHFITNWNVLNFSATVNYDLGCRAVHIAISPWWQYLDVKTKGWEERIVKMWFNA